jgi:hypothetical protein
MVDFRSDEDTPAPPSEQDILDVIAFFERVMAAPRDQTEQCAKLLRAKVHYAKCFYSLDVWPRDTSHPRGGEYDFFERMPMFRHLLLDDTRRCMVEFTGDFLGHLMPASEHEEKVLERCRVKMGFRTKGVCDYRKDMNNFARIFLRLRKVSDAALAKLKDQHPDKSTRDLYYIELQFSYLTGSYNKCPGTPSLCSSIDMCQYFPELREGFKCWAWNKEDLCLTSVNYSTFHRCDVKYATNF